MPFTGVVAVLTATGFAELTACAGVARLLTAGILPTGGCCGKGIGLTTLPFETGTDGLAVDGGALGGLTALLITGAACREAVVFVTEDVVLGSAALVFAGETDPVVVLTVELAPIYRPRKAIDDEYGL